MIFFPPSSLVFTIYSLCPFQQPLMTFFFTNMTLEYTRGSKSTLSHTNYICRHQRESCNWHSYCTTSQRIEELLNWSGSLPCHLIHVTTIFCVQQTSKSLYDEKQLNYQEPTSTPTLTRKRIFWPVKCIHVREVVSLQQELH